MIIFQKEEHLTAEEFINLLIKSSLGERRPIDEVGRISEMLKHANLIITARQNGALIGVARSLTDFIYCTYLSDLAVDRAIQKSGIGRELIRQTKLLTPKAKLILLSAPQAVDYYPKVGLNRHEHCFYLDNIDNII